MNITVIRALDYSIISLLGSIPGKHRIKTVDTVFLYTSICDAKELYRPYMCQMSLDK